MTLVQTATTTREQHLLIPVPQVEPRVAIPLQNLRIPGPTPVPPAVLAELARLLINHRGPEFAAILRRTTTRLQYMFQTTAPVLTFPSSGTGGQESAIVNLFSPDEHVVAITIGHFGNRFAQIAERYGLQVSRIAFPWGEAADPGIVEARLRELVPSWGLAHMREPGVDILSIHLANQCNISFLFKETAQEAKGRAVPLQRFQAVVPSLMVEQVVLNGIPNRHPGTAFGKEILLLALPFLLCG